jgi:maltose alpha-D-glucosyltransferase / alpha-amylase
VLQGYVPNQGDGWSYTLAYLQRVAGTPPAAAADAAGSHGAYLALIQTLATRTAELHRAFAILSGDPAFEPEPAGPQDFQAWKAKVKEEATQTLARLERVEGAPAKALLARRAELLALIEQCAAPKGPGLKTRHHGDYHLGQVLIANNDFVIIDFEGEPSRPLEETRRKHSPLRDVAGMLRSFSYAKWSAQNRPEGALAPKDAALLDAWEAQVRRAFVAAYGEAVKASGLYASMEDVAGLLALFELEKALYELRYEIDNRPAWIPVPLAGVLGMLGGGNR